MTVNNNIAAYPRWLKVLLWSGCGAFALGLAGFAYCGYFSRYMADDYCTPLYFRLYGFWNGQVEAYKIATGRFASTFFIGIFEFFGPFAYRLTPALVILLWAVGMAWFFLCARRFLPFRVPAALAWVGGMMVVLSSIAGTPSRLQSLYWRDGMFNYSFPMVVFPFLLVIVAVQLGEPRPVWSLILSSLGCAVLALTAGGMSETFIAFEVALFLIGAVYSLVVWRGWRRKQAMLLLLFSLLGSLAALAITWFSPATNARQAYFPPTPGLVTLVLSSFQYAKDFIANSFFQKKLLTAMTMGVPALVMFYFGSSSLSTETVEGQRKWWQWLLAIVLLALAGFALMVAIVAPSAYGESSYPEKRVLMIARFSLVITMVALGGVIGLGVRRGLSLLAKEKMRVFNILAIVVLGLLCLYSLVISYQINAKDIPPRQAWAAVWDKRDAQMRAAVASGETTIHVVELDSWETIFEIGPDPHQWVNACAAKYYGLKEIIATPPK